MIMENKEDKKILVTHNSSFHSDDLFACATLSLLLEKRKQQFEIIRSRDKGIIESADYVFDVGGIYDPEKNRFDHHQPGGAGKRENGIEYASFGLVWKHVGMELCSDNQDVWNMIDSKIASPIDAIDNGIDIISSKFEGIVPYGGDQPFLIFSPTWQEDESNIDDIFRGLVLNLTKIIKREIEVATADVLGKKLIESAYSESENKQIIVLETSYPRYLYQSKLCEFSEPIYVIYPSSKKDNWKIEAIRKSHGTMESRKLFPQNWRECFDDSSKLAETTGVNDALFCHRSGFLMTVTSKEGAMKLAQLALENN